MTFEEYQRSDYEKTYQKIKRLQLIMHNDIQFVDITDGCYTVKKWVRGDTEYVDTDEITEELGDVLWYVSQMNETY